MFTGRSREHTGMPWDLSKLARDYARSLCPRCTATTSLLLHHAATTVLPLPSCLMNAVRLLSNNFAIRFRSIYPDVARRSGRRRRYGSPPLIVAGRLVKWRPLVKHRCLQINVRAVIRGRTITWAYVLLQQRNYTRSAAHLSTTKRYPTRSTASSI